VASSHAAILHSLAESALDNAEIHLRTRVVSVESIGQTEQFPKVLVRSEDRQFEFDAVVVTVPLGCLKRQEPTFCPALPPAITRAIGNSSYSSLEKVYITFPTAFWDLPASDSEKNMPKEAEPLHFAHFLHPTYSPENIGSWAVELNFLSSPKTFSRHAQPTLLFYIYGPCAAHITSLITPLSSTSSEYFTVINDFFRPYYALLPNYASNDLRCQPSAVLATNWQNDPLAGYGSYTNFKVSDEPGELDAELKLEEDIKTLRYGMPERGIWLAGEHTAPFVALGTLTGAYWSGEAIGMRILRAHELMGAYND
jgi:Flavin containing amine oxidoreductase